MSAPHQLQFETWKADPTPDNLKGVVTSLGPTIDHVLHSISAGDDPYIKSKARVLTANAVKTFDPAHGASLPTWVSRQLLPLRRVRRQSQSAVRVPEGIQIDAYAIMRAEQDFFEKHEREPDLVELADHAKIPIKRIEHVRKVFRPVTAESSFSSGTNTDGLSSAGAITTDYGNEAFDMVFQSADHLDRRILEMTTGFGGSEIHSGKDIARKLGLSEPQLSRRRTRLSLQVRELESALQNI